MKKTFEMLDLFSGIGGFSLAGEWAGFKTVGFCEIDDFCSHVLFKHWPDVINYGDIKNIHHHKHVDLITGGFPCQPFSIAGKKKGKSDERYLWPEFSRIIKETKPTWVIAENVPGIIDMELDNILDDLEHEGYETRAFCIPACAAGAPHRRERLWVVANASGERCDNGRNNWKKRHIQIDEKLHIETLQSEWEKLKPKSWQTFNAQDWLLSIPNTDSKSSEQTNSFAKPKSFERDAWLGHTRQNREIETWINWQENQSPIPGVDDGLSHIVDRNKSLGNSIVPQIAFILISMIFNIEKYSEL